MNSLNLRQRLANLSPSARQVLATRLRHSKLGRAAPPRLVSFVVCEDSAVVSGAELKNFCEENLPAYMIPRSVEVLPALPKTGAGKVDRAALKKRTLVGQQVPEKRTKNEAEADPTRIERQLIEIWESVLGAQGIQVSDNYFELGGDSLLSIRILSRARKAGLDIEAEKFLVYPTIRQQAQLVEHRLHRPQAPKAVFGRFPVTPIQQWFFDHVTTDPQQWNQCLCVQLPASTEPTQVKQALEQLLQRRDALRVCFVEEGNQWYQELQVEPGQLPFSVVSLSSAVPAERERQMSNEIADAQSKMVLDGAPLLRAVLFLDPNGGPVDLVLAFHHLVVDAFSLGLILEDLDSLLGPSDVAQQPDGYGQWLQGLQGSDLIKELLPDLDFWMQQTGSNRLPLLRDATDQSLGTEQTTQEYGLQLDASNTELLHKTLVGVAKMPLVETLIAAVTHAVAHLTGEPQVLLDVEGHGREPLVAGVDSRSMVGWFTAVYPLNLQVTPMAEPALALNEVKEQLRQVPSSGASFGLLREYGPVSARTKLKDLTPPNICFNYLGFESNANETYRQLAVKDSTMANQSARSPHCERAYGLEINARRLVSGELVLSIRYCRDLYHMSAIEQLAQALRSQLERFCAYAKDPQGQVASPADFPLAEMNQSELDSLAKLLGKS